MPSRVVLVACRSICIGVVLCATSAHGQQPSNDPIMQSWASQKDIVKCFDCHYSGAAPNPLRGSADAGQFCRQNEAQLWLDQDKHAIARQRIEPLSSESVARKTQQLRDQYGDDFEVELIVGPSNQLSRQILRSTGFRCQQRHGLPEVSRAMPNVSCGISGGPSARTVGTSQSTTTGCRMHRLSSSW